MALFRRRIKGCRLFPLWLGGTMQKDKVHDLDAQGDLGQLSIEDTATVRARLGRAGSAPFDPCNGLEQRSPTAKKDLRKLGEWIKAKQKAEELAREAEQTAEALKDP